MAAARDPVHLLRIRTPPPDSEDSDHTDLEKGGGCLPPPSSYHLPGVQRWTAEMENERRSTVELYIGSTMAAAGFFIGGVLGGHPMMLVCSATMGILSCLMRPHTRRPVP